MQSKQAKIFPKCLFNFQRKSNVVGIFYLGVYGKAVPFCRKSSCIAESEHNTGWDRKKTEEMILSVFNITISQCAFGAVHETGNDILSDLVTWFLWHEQRYENQIAIRFIASSKYQVVK